MKIRDIAVYRGRNIYSHKTVIKMLVDLQEHADTPTNLIPGFNDSLLACFPGLRMNTCGLGYPGGFLERLETGTYLGHVLEHVILELQNLLGYDVKYGKTRESDERGRYHVIFEYENEVAALECGKAAVFMLNCLLGGETVDTHEFLDYLKKVAADAELGPSTAAIVREAKLRGIPVRRIGSESLISMGYGKYRRVLEATLTDATSCIAADIATNKHLTKSILSDNGVPVPYGKIVYSEVSAVMAARDVGVPVVLKPFDGNQGKGVCLNVADIKEIRSAFRDAAQYSKGIVVEKFIQGKDFRVLVVGGRVVAVAERVPAGVTGDGVHTVTELVDIVNGDGNRGEGHEKPLTKIKLDAVSLAVLKKGGLSPESVPEAGAAISLKETGNLSTGGIAIDRTEDIHPDNADAAVLAASAIGLDIAGIDFVCEDISVPIRVTGGAVVEVNAAPGIRMHLYPFAGKPRNVARDIVDMLYPPEQAVDFPIVSVTGTNGKTTVTRLIAHALQANGRRVGMTTTSGVYVQGRCVSKGDNTGPVSARTLLANKTIDAAVLETARGGILRAGLGYDMADVGVVTNVTEDHLGMDGVDTLEDLADVKALVVEAVKDSGFAVLNADDAMTGAILERVTVGVVLFTTDLGRALGRYPCPKFRFVYCADGSIRTRHGAEDEFVARVVNISVTGGGAISCNVENCLAATAALWALGIPHEAIASGLMSFTDNPGRFNCRTQGGVTVMADYGHNKAGYEAAIKYLKASGAKRRIGVVGVPGDRLDADVQAVGRLCASAFDRLYIKEDGDLRGRAAGEVAGLLRQAALASGFSEDGISVFSHEIDALKQAVSDSRDGDMIAVFYEELEPIEAYLDGWERKQ